MSAKLDKRDIIYAYDEVGVTILAGGDLLAVKDGALMSKEDLKSKLAKMSSGKKACFHDLTASLKKSLGCK